MKIYRKRYVLFELVMQGSQVTEQQLVNAIRKNLMGLYGEITVADSRVYLQDYNEETGQGVIQVNEQLLEKVLAAASLIHTIESTKISFIPKRTSGTIRALSKKMIT
ncbi:MAG: Rpp14/Pop5 family protein [Candidatus Thorarchaeota archaeon]